MDYLSVENRFISREFDVIRFPIQKRSPELREGSP